MARLEAVRVRRAVRGRLPLPARQDLVRKILRLRPRLRAALPRLQLQGPSALLDQDVPLRRRMCVRALPLLVFLRNALFPDVPLWLTSLLGKIAVQVLVFPSVWVDQHLSVLSHLRQFDDAVDVDGEAIVVKRHVGVGSICPGC